MEPSAHPDQAIRRVEAVTAAQRRTALEIRRRVFIDEQGISLDLERDGLDDHAQHILILADDTPAATARLVVRDAVTGVYGRLAVLREHRGCGLGRRLVHGLEDLARAQGLRRLTGWPHLHLRNFYERLGYRVIPGSQRTVSGHQLIEMEKDLAAPGVLIETPRLTVRRFTAADADSLHCLRRHPEVARYQSWTDFTLDDARTLIRQMELRTPDTPGEWFQLAIVRGDDGTLVGDCVFHPVRIQPRNVEIGFTLGHEHWGRGYATEAVRGLAGWLFEARGKQRLFAVTDGRNPAAHQVLRKAGFERDARFDRMVWFKGEFGPECVWVSPPAHPTA